MKDDTPDYSRYTLDDLHDVARRVNRQLYSDRYALIVEELEMRELPQPTLSTPIVARQPGILETEGCFLPLLRFVGGFVPLALASFWLLIWGDEDFLEPVHSDEPFLWLNGVGLLGLLVITPVVSFYLAFFLREKTRAVDEPLSFRYLIQKCLLALVYGLAGAIFAYVIATILLIVLMRVHSSLFGMPLYWLGGYLIYGAILFGAIGALWFWWWRKGRVRCQP